MRRVAGITRVLQMQHFVSHVESYVSNAKANKAFTQVGYSNWKHAIDSTKGFAGHASNKELLKCTAL